MIATGSQLHIGQILIGSDRCSVDSMIQVRDVEMLIFHTIEVIIHHHK